MIGRDLLATTVMVTMPDLAMTEHLNFGMNTSTCVEANLMRSADRRKQYQIFGI